MTRDELLKKMQDSLDSPAPEWHGWQRIMDAIWPEIERLRTLCGDANDPRPYTHDKGRSCERTDEVLDNYRHRALAAETLIAKLVPPLFLEHGGWLITWWRRHFPPPTPEMRQARMQAQLDVWERTCPNCGHIKPRSGDGNTGPG